MTLSQKILILLVAAAVAGCGRSAPKDTALPSNKPKQNGQWVLESYDANKGFTFSKDGISETFPDKIRINSL
jgi:hypothetical protein